MMSLADCVSALLQRGQKEKNQDIDIEKRPDDELHNSANPFP
jgi:hypothetical protein